MIDGEQRTKQKLTVHKQRWSIFSSRRSLSWAASPSSNSKLILPETSPSGVVHPTEFLCPISGSLMTDPVIVSSGHSFDRACLQACHSLGFSPVLPGSDNNSSFAPDLSSLAIPNLALKSAILNWCNSHSISPPKPLDYSAAETIVRAKMEHLKKQGNPNLKKNRGVIETGETQFAEQGNPDLVENRGIETGEATQKTRVSTSSEESISSSSNSSLPIRLPTRPICYSSRSASSSSEPDETVLDPMKKLKELRVCRGRRE